MSIFSKINSIFNALFDNGKPPKSKTVIVNAGALDSAAPSVETAAYWSYATSASADEIANAAARQTLRARCRYEYLNDAYAMNAARNLSMAVVGTGPRLQLHVDDPQTADRIENAFTRWAKSARLHTSTTVNETTATGKPSPVDNPWSGSYKPVVSPFMGSAFSFTTDDTTPETITGSDTAWMLLADPLDLAILEIAFLNGQRNPIIESGSMDFNKLGMAWRCYFDFGVGLLDPRAAVYSDGSTA